MPSGKTHDLVTFILAPPTFAGAWLLTNSLSLAGVATAAMIFGGLMFGPDLDTFSRQYTRWGWFRVFWYPYRVVFRHRSRWSHGLTFGTIIRVLYFSGIVALLVSLGIYCRAALAGHAPPALSDITRAWRELSAYVAHHAGEHAVWATLVGLWWGAATHTVADVFWSVVRKGSEMF